MSEPNPRAGEGRHAAEDAEAEGEGEAEAATRRVTRKAAQKPTAKTAVDNLRPAPAPRTVRAKDDRIGPANTVDADAATISAAPITARPTTLSL
jgi:hypothetical protein